MNLFFIILLSITFSFAQELKPDERFKTPGEVEEILSDVHMKYPQITKLEVIGYSYEGRPIYALKISDHAQEKEFEPTMLVNALHHAREIMTPEVVLDMISYLTENYESDRKVRSWVDSTEIWAVPMINVDGSNLVWTLNAFWRKNVSPPSGVDLNRNYPFNWAKCGGSGDDPIDSDDYRGESPASEPETRAMMNIVQRIYPVFDLSYHSYGELVIYPFGCPDMQKADPIVTTLGKKLGSVLGYRAGTYELLYNEDGADIDWMYGSQQVIPFMIEVTTSEAGFSPSYDRTKETVEKNRAGWQLLLNRLQGSMLRGRVVNNVFKYHTLVIKNENGSLVKNYKLNPDGSFYVILDQGTYLISLEGFRQKDLGKVTIGADLSEVIID